ncbi:MAG: NB-ARC domain-containing protein, partial [Chloroflexota bacterium]
MLPEEKSQKSVFNIFQRPLGALRELSIGSLMGLITAAGFLPLFPSLGVQFGIDPQATLWLGSIGTNILANWVQHFWDDARKAPPKDQEELLQRLSSALHARIAASTEFRADVALFINQTRTVQAARDALKGREAEQVWFLINIYTELVENRQELKDKLSYIEESLSVLGYKADVILRNMALVKSITETRAGIDEQVVQFENKLKISAIWPVNLPYNEPYYHLPERDVELEKVISVMRDPNGRKIIGVDGLGGLGKTALAVEIGRRCLAEGIFQRVVGESAKQVRLVGDTIESIPGAPAKLSFDDLLDAIARQIGRWDIPTMRPEEKRATLRYLLHQAPHLVIVDNLETAENVRGLVVELQTILDGTRAIVTSRPQLEVDFVHTLKLKGLSEFDSIVFLRAEARSRNIPAVWETSDRYLRQIHKVAGGAPLAMKLIIGQTVSLPLDLVLNNFKGARGNIYTFIYLESWKLLSIEAQKLLIYMGTVVTSFAYDELASVGIADNDEMLQQAIRELTKMSLLGA